MLTFKEKQCVAIVVISFEVMRFCNVRFINYIILGFDHWDRPTQTHKEL